MAANSTAALEVREQGPASTTVTLNGDEDQSEYLLSLVRRAPDALDKLEPVIDAETAKRFVDELNQAEDLLQTARKQTADLEQQKQAAQEKLNQEISAVSWIGM